MLMLFMWWLICNPNIKLCWFLLANIAFELPDSKICFPIYKIFKCREDTEAKLHCKVEDTENTSFSKN